ncbi:glycopeptide antibiotics resistance protein [Companilactobacillus sp. RD055328]|uniref:VanZ family protein n=1 Tax=Companilactobacillus sp. RD055328 TaxID=2916634 RepID=UPI001FC8A3BC|nr:VanZ family protein [Companilactobacillus sp. RD055328]GKQ42974.1 glycopeptide antibiotics resistance protein [Companilactobacillus sp. RD055328]
MIFLNPLYQQLIHLYADKINHFPLIRLSILSLDKTIFYLLIYIVLRILYLKKKKRKVKFKRELGLGLFVAYILLLLFLTVFRAQYFPWDIHIVTGRSLSEINIIPIIETLKLAGGTSIVDFFYNLYGNIAWFIPFGIMVPALKKKRINLLQVTIMGALFSISIETAQFFLQSGVTDIDDVIFNVLGVILGYCLYQFGKSLKKAFK